MVIVGNPSIDTCKLVFACVKATYVRKTRFSKIQGKKPTIDQFFKYTTKLAKDTTGLKWDIRRMGWLLVEDSTAWGIFSPKILVFVG